MIMIIVNPNTSNTFVIIPNAPILSEFATDYSIEIIDEQTNTSTGILLNTFRNVSFDNDLMYLLFQNTSMFYEGGFFTVKFFLDNQLIYKDKIFATSQEKETYSINNNNYSTPEIENNDYIII